MWLVGGFAEAGKIKERVLTALLESVGPEHPSTLLALRSYANTLSDYGQYDKAASLQERLRVLNAKKYGPEARATLELTNPLAISYIRGGAPDKAQRLMEQNHPDHRARRRKACGLAGAAVLLQDSWRIARGTVAQRTGPRAVSQVPRTGHTHVRTGDHFMLGRVAIFWAHVEPDIARRIELAQQAYRIGKSIEATDTVWRAADELRAAYEKLGTPDLAIMYGKQAINALQGLRAQVSASSEGAGSKYLTDKRSVYTELADLMIAQGRLAEAQDVLRMLKEDEYHDFVTRSEKVDTRQTVMTLNPQEQGLGGALPENQRSGGQNRQRKSRTRGPQQAGPERDRKAAAGHA